MIVGFPAEDEAAFERTLETVRAARLTKVHVFPYSPRPGTRTADDDPVPPEVKKERSARLRALSDEACRARWEQKVGARTSSSSTGPAAATAPTTRPGSSTRRSGSSSASAPRAVTRGGDPCRCLTTASSAGSCTDGDHVAKADGFVAIRDINPQAETHLLVMPERHVDTFRDVAEFPADEAKRMLDFVAEVARGAGLEDYRVLVNVGPGGGQTVFHLHWHILGGRIRRDAGMTLIDRNRRRSSTTRCARGTPRGATRCA